MQVLIIEDEIWGAERLQELIIETDPAIKVAGIVGSIQTAIDWIKTNPEPDLVFLDIELSDGQSFEIFDSISLSCPIIFTTSYSEYALKAFELNSIDYLLKPIRRTALEKSLAKLRQLKNSFNRSPENISDILRQLQASPHEYKSRFLVKRGSKLKTVAADEVAYFYGEDKIVFLVSTNREKFIVAHTLEELESLLDPCTFFRANRSFIVHIHSISDIRTEAHGKLRLDITPSPSKEVIVSREKAVAFKNWMGK